MQYIVDARQVPSFDHVGHVVSAKRVFPCFAVRAAIDVGRTKVFVEPLGTPAAFALDSKDVDLPVQQVD